MGFTLKARALQYCEGMKNLRLPITCNVHAILNETKIVSGSSDATIRVGRLQLVRCSIGRA